MTVGVSLGSAPRRLLRVLRRAPTQRAMPTGGSVGTINVSAGWHDVPLIAKRKNRMSILAWLILGLIAGFIASKIVNKTGEGVVIDIILGVVGAFVGGFLFTFFGEAPVTGLNIYSIVVAVIGAIVVLFIYHAVAGRRAI
jgi:uncharacterized membrane protein YeaQ/YmgE (transglycosylase-associated protein family)